MSLVQSMESWVTTLVVLVDDPDTKTGVESCEPSGPKSMNLARSLETMVGNSGYLS